MTEAIGSLTQKGIRLTNMTEFFEQFFCEYDEKYSIVIDDDGRVAYAYLYEEKNIIGDVWLYNQASTPLITQWHKEDMPFLNPKEYIKDEIEPILRVDDIKLEWTISNNSINNVLIYIKETLIAKLIAGATPGWSTCVSKDGPLARML